jgi:hypothetical protein
MPRWTDGSLRFILVARHCGEALKPLRQFGLEPRMRVALHRWPGCAPI